MEIRCDQFYELSKKGLSDSILQRALQSTVIRLKDMRNAAFSLLDNSEALRERA